MRYFKLDENRQSVEVTKEEWVQWRNDTFGNPICSVGRTPVAGTIISTVFLGMIPDDEDVLPYETIDYKDRVFKRTYASWEEAQRGHDEKVNEIKNLIKQ